MRLTLAFDPIRVFHLGCWLSIDGGQRTKGGLFERFRCDLLTAGKHEYAFLVFDRFYDD